MELSNSIDKNSARTTADSQPTDGKRDPTRRNTKKLRVPPAVHPALPCTHPARAKELCRSRNIATKGYAGIDGGHCNLR
jgi:hypothetical protein